MRTPLLLLSMFLGVVLTVHLAMNGAVGAALNNPRVGNALFWVIGAVTAIVIGATGWQAGALSGLEGNWQRFRENVECVVRAGADADMLVEAGRRRLAHEHALAGQGLQHRHGKGAVPATVNGNEIGGRGQGGKAVLGGDGAAFAIAQRLHEMQDAARFAGKLRGIEYGVSHALDHA